MLDEHGFSATAVADHGDISDVIWCISLHLNFLLRTKLGGVETEMLGDGVVYFQNTTVKERLQADSRILSTIMWELRTRGGTGKQSSPPANT